MFQFDNVLTAGTVLVRQQIESQNYEPSGGADGWAILANGDAFFNGVFIKGAFATGPPAPYVAIPDGSANIEFFTPNNLIVAPGTIGSPTSDDLTLFSPKFVAPDDTQSRISLSAGTASFPGNIIGGPEATVDLNLSVVGDLRAGLLDAAAVQDTSSRTTTSTAYTFIAGSTLTTTIRWPKSYAFLVSGWSLIANSTAAGAQGIMSCEVRDSNAAGTLLFGATDIASCRCDGNQFQSASFSRLFQISAAQPMLSGTLFIRAMYRSTVGTNTANFGQGYLAVTAIPNGT